MGKLRLVALSVCAWALGGCVFFGNPFDLDNDGTPDVRDCDNGSAVLNDLDEDDDGWTSCEGDCDDRRATVFPTAVEVCEGRDTDCDGAVPDEEIDIDGDGFAACEGDCNEAARTIFPGADELCDGLDSDCDGSVPPEEDIDVDADGFPACSDCDDGDGDVYPGAAEACDGVDTDCDGEALPTEVDFDGDGSWACADCDDQNPQVHPGADEVCDGRDTDCDGALGAAEIDVDGDGYGPCQGDCAPGDPNANPGAVEACNGEDDDCDGSVPLDESLDSDGDGVTDCDDCAPHDPATNPGAGDPLPPPTPETCVAFTGGPIATDSAARVPGTTSGERMGDVLGSLGDVDGDGVDDFAVAAPLYEGALGGSEGRLLVISGADALLGGAVDPLTTIGADALGDRVGSSVAALGDLDGDGRGDFAVGATGVDGPGGSNAGAVGVFFGSGIARGVPLTLSDADLLLDGEVTLDAFGTAMATAGDVDHDGLTDLVVGAPGYDPGGLVNGGKVYVFRGARILSGAILDAGDATISFLGAEAGDSLGDSVSGAGDVDGDGCDDVVAGAEWAGSSPRDAGRAYVWSGGDVRGGGEFAVSDALASLEGAASFDRAGSVVASAGDVDGDGLGDVLVASSQSASNGTQAGSVYLLLGSSLSAGGAIGAGDADARFIGPNSYARLGLSAANAGDVDGDGRDDILLGGELSASEAGMATVVLGCEAVAGGVLTLSAGVSSWSGAESGELLGSAVAGLGDLDGDGLDDLLVGSRGWDDGASAVGRADVLLSPYAAP